MSVTFCYTGYNDRMLLYVEYIWEILLWARWLNVASRKHSKIFSFRDQKPQSNKLLNFAKDIHHIETGNLKSQQERTEDRRLISGLGWSKWTHRGKQLCGVRRRWEIHRVLQPNVVYHPELKQQTPSTEIWSTTKHNTTRGKEEVTTRAWNEGPPEGL